MLFWLGWWDCLVVLLGWVVVLVFVRLCWCLFGVLVSVCLVGYMFGVGMLVLVVCWWW